MGIENTGGQPIAVVLRGKMGNYRIENVKLSSFSSLEEYFDLSAHSGGP